MARRRLDFLLGQFIIPGTTATRWAVVVVGEADCRVALVEPQRSTAVVIQPAIANAATLVWMALRIWIQLNVHELHSTV